MKVDCYASEVHFCDHLAPVWKALGEEQGEFMVSQAVMERAARRGIEATMHPHHLDRPVLVASYGDVKRMRKQGRTRIAFIEHGIGQSYIGHNSGSYAGGKDRDDVSLFLMPNTYSADKWKTAYPNAQVEVIGSPHLDDLPARDESPGPTVALSFHWQCALVPETMGAFLHYRRGLAELAQNFNVIGHGHPRALPLLVRHYRRASIPMVEDFADVCRLADLYICDNSSSLYEFAATGRPVIVMNDPAYRKDVHHGLRFWDAANVGIQVNDSGELLKAIPKALADPPSLRKKRAEALRLVYAYRQGAADRAATHLRVWAST